MHFDFHGKPCLIYCMPRSRSTAILQSCVKKNKLFEPFNPLILFGVNYNHIQDIDQQNRLYLEAHAKYRDLAAWYETSVVPYKWDKLFASLSGKDTVSKIISNSLYQWIQARLWFQDVQEKNTHNIFVIWRSFKEVMISNIFADKLGYFKDREIDPYEFIVDQKSFREYRQQIEYYLQFMPRTGYLITWENLPEPYFNKSLVSIADQETHQKLGYIKNLDFVLEQLECIEKIYKPLFDEKFANLIKL